MDVGADILAQSLERFRYYKSLGEGALAQLEDDELHWSPDPETNSVAVIVKHLSGNMRSRWTDFLKSDGEKPDRDREAEFVDDAARREVVLERWEAGWGCLLEAVSSLNPDDLTRTVTIRSEPHSVIAAIQRQLSHVPYHVGQIVLMARLQRGQHWKSLSIPRGQSQAFNATMDAKHNRR